MLRCFSCNGEAFLIRGVCKGCGPRLHSDYEDIKSAFEVTAEQFKSATGKEPLEDWYGFEAFILERAKA